MNRFIPARAGNTTIPALSPNTRAVHPRSRGEHRPLTGREVRILGSSPLARGTRTARRSGCRCPAVHPRSRGEHEGDRDQHHIDRGSSPLARGTPPTQPGRRVGRRFIPARAGNTKASRCSRTASAVHPRSRGEHLTPSPLRMAASGSSPLARGTRIRTAYRCIVTRFIPARAGNTAVRARSRARRPVHPRSRGEHANNRSHRFRFIGSSPLARGTPQNTRGLPHAQRFIPARAGNTSFAAAGSVASTVHPRSRGEHASCAIRSATRAGSSPLARGTRTPRRHSIRSRRFIPARAGNTWGWDTPAGTTTVHPRSRGEHTLSSKRANAASGSSPLARGTLWPQG